MRAVIDTNVLVSGLLNPSGPPGEIIDMVLSRQIEAVYDDRIIHEYREILLRKKFSFTQDAVESLLVSLATLGKRVSPLHISLELPDDGDRPFLECALAMTTPLLITGNEKHYPAHCAKGVEVIQPKRFLEKYLK